MAPRDASSSGFGHLANSSKATIGRRTPFSVLLGAKMEGPMAGKSARHRAKLKAKHMKKRSRDCGFSKVRKKGGRVKRSGKRPVSGVLVG
jgi:hypothetical protein